MVKIPSEKGCFTDGKMGAEVEHAAGTERADKGGKLGKDRRLHVPGSGWGAGQGDTTQ